MARLDAAIPPPRLSVLDRLLDDEPDYAGPEEQTEYHSGLGAFKRSVLRDLQWLLNARVGTRPETKDPMQGTVARLGLPDITNLDLKNERQREILRRLIADAIARFEPRLDFVSVSVREGSGSQGRTQFHVDARLRVEPEPTKLSFDATVVWKNRTVEVK
jgi:type VI secretion system protein ImpF